MEMKRADLAKPYDPKKSIWVPEEGGGYVEALLESEAGGKTIAMVGHEVTIHSVILYRLTQSKSQTTITRSVHGKFNCIAVKYNGIQHGIYILFI